MQLTLQFVESVPRPLEPATLYVSITYATAVHLCCCGCGIEVVTPLSPVGWKLIFDGETASLDPSIGNWNFPCRSHYWIVRNQVRWASRWSAAKATLAQQRDRRDREQYYGGTSTQTPEQSSAASASKHTPSERESMSTEEWLRLRRGDDGSDHEQSASDDQS